LPVLRGDGIGRKRIENWFLPTWRNKPENERSEIGEKHVSKLLIQESGTACRWVAFAFILKNRQSGPGKPGG
jgi:hypothetical protein